MEGRFAALVRGPSPVFPRGILGVVVVWYAAASAALLTVYRLLDWYGPIALAGLLLGAVTLLAVLSTMRNNAFVADQSAIWLGLRVGAARRVGRRRRALRKLPWSDVEQVRITWRPYGVRVDIMLGPAAPLAGRANPVLSGFAGIMLLVLPVSYLVRLPSIVVPHAGLRRYRVQIYELRPESVRAALRELAPRTVAVTVYSLFGRPRTIAAPPPAGMARPAAAAAASSPPAVPAASGPSPVPAHAGPGPRQADARPPAPDPPPAGPPAKESPAADAPAEQSPAADAPAEEPAAADAPAKKPASASAPAKEPAAAAAHAEWPAAPESSPQPLTRTAEPQPTRAVEPQTTAPAADRQTAAPA
ncbi:MAG TPA: hypothetical protein VGI64_09345, partial [Streptosporangiaceae bacterium]